MAKLKIAERMTEKVKDELKQTMGGWDMSERVIRMLEGGEWEDLEDVLYVISGEKRDIAMAWSGFGSDLQAQLKFRTHKGREQVVFDFNDNPG